MCEVHICRTLTLIHSSCLSVDHILPQVIVSLKNQSLDIFELQLSLKSPSTVELFRALPQSGLKEFHVTLFDRQMV